MLKHLRSINLTAWILIALVAGALLGVFAPDWALRIAPMRGLFLNGVKCIIAPLIFASIVCGINSSGSLGGLGRMGLRALVWFEVATTVALFVGLLFVNWLRPGDGLQVGTQVSPEIAEAAQVKMSFTGFIEHLLPSNFGEAVVKGDVLQIVLLSMVFGIAVLMAGEKGQPVLAFCKGLNDVMFKFTEIIMLLAPIGVGSAIAGTIAEHGLGVLLPMAKVVGTLYVALLVFVGVVLVPGLYLARVRVGPFFRELRSTLVLAFATTSSESAYPSALKALERMGVPNRISAFVLPLGYSFNLDGSTLYLAVASIFIAQAAHVEMPMTQQITMMLTLILTTKGVAAVPRASMVVLSATLVAFGLPLEGLVLIVGVDTFMDMARTTINLLGNCVATAVVAYWEGEDLHPDFRRV